MGRPNARSWLTALPAVVLLLAACTTDSNRPPDGASTTTGPATSLTESTSSTAPPGSTTTSVVPNDPLPSGAALLITYEDSLSVRLPGGESFALPGDYEVPLAVAFDDLNGGIVFQYSSSATALDDSILHLRDDSGEPTPLVSAAKGHQLRLLDVDRYNGRLHAMYLDRAPDGSQALSVVGLDGGAPVVLFTGRAMLSGSLAAEHFSYTQQAPECRIGIVADTTGTETARWGCPDGGAGLTLGGSRAAWIGTDGVEVAEVEGDAIDPEWDQDDLVTAQLFDFDGTKAAIRASATAFRFLDEDGSVTRFETGQRLRSVTLLRAPISLAATASLGGLSAPDGQCSASGFPARPTPVDGLTLAATDTRQAIVAAAHDCDFKALEALASSDLAVPDAPDLGRYWLGREQQRFDDLAVMLRILDLSYAQTTDEDGQRLFVWPAAAAVDSPTEAQWLELGAVYNEEDIEAMRQAGRYGGVVMTIDLDGAWLTAAILDE